MSDTYQMAMNCKKEHCEAEMQKRRDAIMKIGNMQVGSSQHMARLFELRFRLNHLAKSKEEKVSIQNEIDDIDTSIILKRRDMIREHIDVIADLECELENCQDSMLGHLASQISRWEKQCTDEECEGVLRELKEILEYARNDKMTVKLHTKFKNKSDELFKILDKKWLAERKNENENENEKPKQKEQTKEPEEPKEPRYVYLQKSNDLIIAGLKYESCREKFKKMMFMNDERKARQEFYQKKMKEESHDAKALRRLEYEKSKEFVEFSYKGEVYSCFLQHEDVSTLFAEVLKALKQYVSTLIETQGKKNANAKNEKKKSEKLMKILEKVKQIRKEYKIDLPVSTKAKMFKEFRNIENDIAKLTEEFTNAQK